MLANSYARLLGIDLSITVLYTYTACMQEKLCMSVPCSVHLDVAAEREVFPHGVTLEAIVSQYAAEVRVV